MGRARAISMRSCSPEVAKRPMRARHDFKAVQHIHLPSAEARVAHRERYRDAVPYKHAVVEGLIDDELVS